MAESTRECYKAASSGWTTPCRSSRSTVTIPGPLRDSRLEATHIVISPLNHAPQSHVEDYLQATWPPVERVPLLSQVLMINPLPSRLTL
ncbi:hypothetical protein ALQ33_00853 [Pseudomonas syringae pv. philadelphi]|uniref:Uncharacterized protein n=1 Tax=Pseudomonas syringae pv. philadelphi TaxID=251706 RepID=A0A3M3ZCQ7_9PSED|nr:hypothetical protein ALQ33_00853 [Pseudomonas syringae pv. philadelphi]